MYVIDERDRVVRLDDLPRRPSARRVDPESSAEPAALVRFRGVCASMFGPPNDETFHGHPLAARGLRPYSASEIHGSSWIRGLERMSSVHPYHRRERYAELRHFVLAFHDSTFECVAGSYDFVLASGPLDRLVAEMLSLVRGGIR